MKVVIKYDDFNYDSQTRNVHKHFTITAEWYFFAL